MVILLKKSVLYALALVLFSTVSFAQSVSGVVTNRTNNRPAAGDDVVLLKLAQGMQELTRTKTDSKGRFTLQVPDDATHLVRVTHDKANYFHPVQPGTQSIEMDVYTAAPEIDGISLTEDVLQVQTEQDGKSLKVVEHFLLKNDSSPARTLFSDHPFELNLPPGATVEGGAAKGPSGMAVQQPLVPLGGDLYTMIFPVRPGETEFHIFYHLPYTGSFTFRPRPTLVTANLAVMLPKSMDFKPGPSSGYSSVTDDAIGASAQAFVAREVKPSQPSDFTVSGTGQLPRDAPRAAGQPAGGQPAANVNADPNTDTRPGGGIGTPVDKDAVRESWVSKYRWWLVAGLFLLMCAGAAILLARPPGTVPAKTLAYGNSASVDPLQTLRDEMFTLETDRLEGHVTEPEYTELKRAFDLVLRRALARSARVVPE